MVFVVSHCWNCAPEQSIGYVVVVGRAMIVVVVAEEEMVVVVGRRVIVKAAEIIKDAGRFGDKHHQQWAVSSLLLDRRCLRFLNSQKVLHSAMLVICLAQKGKYFSELTSRE